MPLQYCDCFIEHCLICDILREGSGHIYTLNHFSAWLQVKAQAKSIVQQVSLPVLAEKQEPIRRNLGRKGTPTTMYLNSTATPESEPEQPNQRDKWTASKGKLKFQPFCPYGNNMEHFLGTCPEVKKFSPVELKVWIDNNNRRYRCAHCHTPDKCTLNKPCNICKWLHLTILHGIALQEPQSPQGSRIGVPRETGTLLVRAQAPVPVVGDSLYVDRPKRSQRLMLKVAPVFLTNGQQRLKMNAIIDDGSERTIIVSAAVMQLQLKGRPEILNLRTVRQDVIPITGETVSFHISLAFQKKKKIHITGPFTAPVLNLAEHSCPTSDLQRVYCHL